MTFNNILTEKICAPDAGTLVNARCHPFSAYTKVALAVQFLCFFCTFLHKHRDADTTHTSTLGSTILNTRSATPRPAATPSDLARKVPTACVPGGTLQVSSGWGAQSEFHFTDGSIYEAILLHICYSRKSSIPTHRMLGSGPSFPPSSLTSTDGQLWSPTALQAVP